MNSTNKKASGVKSIPQRSNPPTGHLRQVKPVAQLKPAASGKGLKRPIAPPVYRPQALPKVMQLKTANGVANSKPIAPPVYRPQPTPRVLQTKATNSRPNSNRPREQALVNLETIQKTHSPVGAYKSAVSSPKFNSRSSTLQRAQRNTQSCNARLSIANQWYAGKTGTQYGHAEMHALHRFIVEACHSDVETASSTIDGTDDLRVECEEKPVCIKCGTVLGRLGFTPKDDNTEWGTGRMEPTEWGVSMKVRELLSLRQINYEEIKRL